jgi:hypothetical protein
LRHRKNVMKRKEAFGLKRKRNEVKRTRRIRNRREIKRTRRTRKKRNVRRRKAVDEVVAVKKIVREGTKNENDEKIVPVRRKKGNAEVRRRPERKAE